MKLQAIRVVAASVALWGLAFGAGCVEDDLASQGSRVYSASVAVPGLAAAALTPTATATPAEAQPPEPAPAPPPASQPEPPKSGDPQPASPKPEIPKPADTNALAEAEADPLPATNAVKQVVKPAVVPESLSPALAELARMAQAGVSEEVLLAYVANSTNVFNVGADEIVYLNDLGISNPVITRLIEQDASPGSVARKQARKAVKPLPAELILREPATNLYPAKASPPPPPSNAPAAEAEPPAYANPAPAYVGAPTGEVPTDVSQFQTALSPYGNWVQVPDYGLCWQPTVAVVNSSWRPYADNGCWYWTDRGWYWYSYYSWGWAPFHYGRWCRPAGYGWVWTPDTDWGPAWVTWRYTPYYCGWAPLPPRCHYVSGFGLYYNGGSVGLGFGFGFGYDYYSFVHWNSFCDRYPYRYYVPHGHARNIYHESTPMNAYGRGPHPIHEGPGFDRAARLSRTEIRQVTVREAPPSTRPRGRQERLVNDGNSTVLERPALAPPSQRAQGRPTTPRIDSVRPAGATAGATPATPRVGREAPGHPGFARAEVSRGEAPAASAPLAPAAPRSASAPAQRPEPRSARTAESAAAAPAASAAEATAPSGSESPVARPASPRSDRLTSPRQSEGQRSPARQGSSGTPPAASRSFSGPNVIRSTPRSDLSSPADNGSAAPGSFNTARVETTQPTYRTEPTRQQLRESTLARPAPTASPARPATALPAPETTRPSVPSSRISPPPPQYRSDSPRSFAESPRASSVPTAPPSVSRPAMTMPSAAQPSFRRAAPAATRQPDSAASSSRFVAPSAQPAPRSYSPPPAYRSAPSMAPAARMAPAPAMSAPAARMAPAPSVAPPARMAPSPAMNAPAARPQSGPPPSGNRSPRGER